MAIIDQAVVLGEPVIRNIFWLVFVYQICLLRVDTIANYLQL